MRAARIILVMTATPALIVAFFAVLVYGAGIDNRYTRSINENLYFLPAAMVSGKFVFFGEVEREMRMYQNAVNFQSKGAVIDYPKERASILDNLIDQKIVNDLVSRKKIGVENQELDEYYSHLSATFETREIVKIFAVSEEEFKRIIVRPDLQSMKLRAALYAQSTDSKEYQRVIKIKQLIDDGLDFSEAVRSYSEDEDTKYISGDLGFKTAGELGPWLSPAVVALQSSSTSEVIVSPEGYHILRVASRDSNAVPEEIDVQHLLIRGFDFERYLEEQRKNYRIYTFMRD